MSGKAAAAVETMRRPVLRIFRKPKKRVMSSEAQKKLEELEKEQPLTLKEFYPVNPPFGYVGIKVEKETGGLQYLIIEPTMDDDEKQVLSRLKAILKEEIDVPLSVLKDEVLSGKFLMSQIRKAIDRYKLDVSEDAVDKFTYYIRRDFLGYGIIDILTRDIAIEDISCNGVGIPVYVWHRFYESIPSNIAYATRDELDAFVTRLAYKAGHQISISSPILEGALPEGFRVHLTLEEVSKRGDTFTIRKTKTDPFTIIDLINFGTVSAALGAYFWILVENLRSIILAGATASGKTSLLNSVCTFIRPEMKVVTIEEVRELRLHDNWIPMVTRPSFQPGVQEVTLFDLLKSSLRQRPDYIIVGEVRGEEAYTLFQSIAIGHGGLCTIHAENVDAVEKRLLTKPMDIPSMLIPMMNAIALISRTKRGETVIRRVLNVSEIVGINEKTGKATLKRISEWNPITDTFDFSEKTASESFVFKKIADFRHIQVEALLEELSKREQILSWMTRREMRDYSSISNVVRNYYLNPGDVYNRTRLESQ